MIFLSSLDLDFVACVFLVVFFLLLVPPPLSPKKRGAIVARTATTTPTTATLIKDDFEDKDVFEGASILPLARPRVEGGFRIFLLGISTSPQVDTRRPETRQEKQLLEEEQHFEISIFSSIYVAQFVRSST